MRFSSVTIAVYAVVAGTVFADQVCDNGIYAVLAPLSKYPPAQSFCSKKYPASNTKRSPDLAERDGHSPQCRRRDTDAQSTSKTTAKTSMTTSTVPKTTTKDKNEELLLSLQTFASNVAKTFCSCIQEPKITTTAKSTTTGSTKKSSTTSKSSSTKKSSTTSKTISTKSSSITSVSSSSVTTSTKTSSSSSSGTTKSSTTTTTSPGSTTGTTTSTSQSTTKTSSTWTTTSATTSSSTTTRSSVLTTTSSTTTPSSTTSSSSSSTTSIIASGPVFKISVQVTAVRRQKRLVLWVKFVGNDATVVQSEADASTFTIVDGYLMYGSEYVTSSGNTGYASFSKSTVKPAEPGTWSESGGQVTLGGAQGFCTTADNSIIIILTQQPPMSCTPVVLVENAEINNSPATTSATTPDGPTTTPKAPVTTPNAPVTTPNAPVTTPNAPATTPKASKQGTYTGSPTTRATTSTISCTEGVYTATARCSCRWSIRCNSHAVSEFGTQPTVQQEQTWQACAEACNADMMCSGLWYDPGSLTCYLYDTPGDNVLYGYNTGPWIALSPIDCDPACPAPTTTKRVATTTSASPTPVPTGCRYEEYQATSGGCNCVWPIKCGTQANTTPDEQYVLSDHHACVNRCDLTSKCQLFTYDPNTSICRIWYDGSQPALSAPGVYWCARLDNWCPASQCPS